MMVPLANPRKTAQKHMVRIVAHLLFQALARHKAALAEAATTAQDQEVENIALATLERRVILGSDEANQRSRY